MKVRSAENAMKQVLIHDIEAPDKMFELDAVSKLNADWRQISMLMAVGRDRPGYGSRPISTGSAENRRRYTRAKYL